MKKTVAVMAILGLGSMAMAGGDFTAPVEPEIIVPVVTEAESVSGPYAGLGLSLQRTYSTDSSFWDDAATQDRTVGITGILGYDFNEYIAVEGRISSSIAKEDYADVLSYSLFVKPQYPVTESIKVYGLLGLGTVQVDNAYTTGEILDESGFQWGLGGSYALTERVSLFADYTSLASDAETLSYYNELSHDAITAGATYRF